jgi:hypothetical protein
MLLSFYHLREGVSNDSQEQVQEEKGAHNDEHWEVDCSN